MRKVIILPCSANCVYKVGVFPCLLDPFSFLEPTAGLPSHNGPAEPLAPLPGLAGFDQSRTETTSSRTTELGSPVTRTPRPIRPSRVLTSTSSRDHVPQPTRAGPWTLMKHPEPMILRPISRETEADQANHNPANPGPARCRAQPQTDHGLTKA